MFENLRKCLDDFENVIKKDEFEWTKEDADTLDYFNLHLAEALMKNWGDSDKVARIILAEKGFFEKTIYKD